MVGKAFKAASISTLFTLLSVFAFAFFIKAIGIIFEGWFAENAIIIAWISGGFLLFFVIVGIISYRSLKDQGKTVLPGL